MADLTSKNLHELGPQIIDCAGDPIQDEDGGFIADESGRALCPESVVPTIPFVMTVTGTSYAIGLEENTGFGTDPLVYSFNVDWGDGSDDDITAWDQAELDHAYSGSGPWTITIDGVCPNLSLGLSGPESGQRSKLTTIEAWGDTGWTYMQNAFNDCYNMTINATDKPNFSACTDIRWMFRECRSIVTGAEGWNFSVLQTDSIRYLFDHCDNFNCDVSGWNLTGITDMEGVFNYCQKFNNDITGWDTSAVTDMSFLFFFNDDLNHASIANLDTSACTNFYGMFGFCNNFNIDISGWTIPTALGPVDMGQMLKSCDLFNHDLDSWDVSAVTNMTEMFVDCFVFDQDFPTWDTGNVTDMSYMFGATYGIGVFNGDISGFDVSSCLNMRAMFIGQNLFNQSPAAWGANTANVTSMRDMFRSCDAFNQPIAAWDVSSVTTMDGMLMDCDAFNQSLAGWDVSACTTFEDFLRQAYEFNGSVAGWTLNTLTPVSMKYMFKGCWKFNQSLSSWDVSQVTNFSYFLFDAIIFNGSLSGWDTGNATLMNDMFNGCTPFDQDISGFDVSKVTSFTSMLFNCTNFNQDISSWDVSAGTSFNTFMSNGNSFSTANYDLLLNAWSLLTLSPNETIDFAFGLNYTIATSQAARDIMTGSPNNWTINDGGGI